MAFSWCALQLKPEIKFETDWKECVRERNVHFVSVPSATHLWASFSRTNRNVSNHFFVPFAKSIDVHANVHWTFFCMFFSFVFCSMDFCFVIERWLNVCSLNLWRRRRWRSKKRNQMIFASLVSVALWTTINNLLDQLELQALLCRHW